MLNLGNRCRDSSGPDASSIGNPHQWSLPQSPAQGHRNSSLHHLPPASHVDLFGRCSFGPCCADVLKSRPRFVQAFHVQAAVGLGTWARTGSSPQKQMKLSMKHGEKIRHWVLGWEYSWIFGNDRYIHCYWIIKQIRTCFQNKIQHDSTSANLSRNCWVVWEDNEVLSLRWVETVGHQVKGPICT